MAQAAKKEFQPQCVYWDGTRTYFIFAEGILIDISWQESNRLIFRENWAAEIAHKPDHRPTPSI